MFCSNSGNSFVDFWNTAGVANGFVAVPLLFCVFINDSAAQLSTLYTAHYFR
jgi:hypothetical protein